VRAASERNYNEEVINEKRRGNSRLPRALAQVIAAVRGGPKDDYESYEALREVKKPRAESVAPARGRNTKARAVRA
jgi:hypothetical protein